MDWYKNTIAFAISNRFEAKKGQIKDNQYESLCKSLQTHQGKQSPTGFAFQWMHQGNKAIWNSPRLLLLLLLWNITTSI